MPPLAHHPRTPLSGMSLDRVSTLRKDPGWIAARLRDPAARTIAATKDCVVLDAEDPAHLHRGGVEGIAPEAAILVGLDGERPLFARDLERPATATEGKDGTHASPGSSEATPPAGGRLVTLREAGTDLPRAEGGLAGCLVGLLNWHRAHRFCAVCGAVTIVTEGGYERCCPRCGTHHFPRTDPAVIMLVERGSEILLGRRPTWPARRYSVLAGFVSPGESLEEAVVREVREESGIQVREPRFVASQPWPFPSSLMLGFTARADGGEPRTVDGELEDVRWFSFAEVAAAIDGENDALALPYTVSIAHLLIERWVAERRAGN